MSKGLEIPITNKSEAQLLREGWLLSGRYDLTDKEDELQVRNNLERWRRNDYEVICNIVDGRTQLFRKNK